MVNSTPAKRNPSQRTLSILQDIKGGKLTNADVSRKWKVSRQRIDQICDDYNVISPLLVAKREKQAEKKRAQKQQLKLRAKKQEVRQRERQKKNDAIRKYHAMGLPAGKIAPLVSLSPGTILSRGKKELNLHFRCPKFGDISPQTEKALTLLATQPTLSLKDIVQKSGCSLTTVANLRRNKGTKHHRITSYRRRLRPKDTTQAGVIVSQT